MENAKATIANSFLIVLIAATMGIIFNYHIIKDFFSSKTKISPTENLSKITINAAKELFDKGEGLFIDARSKDEYERGHIKGAINILIGKTDEYLEKNISGLPKDKILITYCSRAYCRSSFKLTRILRQYGFEKVRTFYGGWAEWKKAGYPIE